MSKHRHQWGKVEVSHFAGTPNRRCRVCGEVLVYLDDEEDDVRYEYCASDHKEWESEGLKDFGDFADCVTFCNQSEYGDGQLEGCWYYGDDESLTIYTGIFGNYNSPGASHYTYATVYELVESYELALKAFDAQPEYDEEEEENDE